MSHHRRVADAGSAAIELILLAPALIALLLLVVGLGRLAEGDLQILVAAAQAARAASLQRGGQQAMEAAADDAALSALTGDQVSCAHSQTPVTIDPGSVVAPGGVLTVTLTCTTRLSDLFLAGFPGVHTWTATVTVPLDSYEQASS